MQFAAFDDAVSMNLLATDDAWKLQQMMTGPAELLEDTISVGELLMMDEVEGEEMEQ